MQLVPISTAAMTAVKYEPGMEEMFKFKTKFDEEVCSAIVDGGTMWLPRNCCPMGKDFRTLNDVGAIDCKVGPINSEQQQFIAKSLDLLGNDHSHIVEAPTGWGKSYFGSAVAVMSGQATLVVVPKTDLMESWYDTLVNLVGLDPSEIGIAQGPKLKYKGCRVVLGMINSLVTEDKYDQEFWRHFGLMIVDEVHRVAADTFIRVCQKCPAKLRLGLSATPDRKDGKWKLVEQHIGKTAMRGKIIPMKTKVLVKKTGWKIPKVKRFDPAVGGVRVMEIPCAPGRMMGVIGAMADSAERNQIIVDFARQAVDHGRTVVVMSDTLSHLQTLFQKIGEVVSGENVGWYIGGKKKHELQAAAHKRVVLATYKMCDTGTNFPHWDTLVLATPRADVRQTIGRVGRFKEGKKQPVVLDLVDHNSIFQGFYLAREKQYYGVGADIVRLK